MTKTVLYSELRQHLSTWLDTVSALNGEPIIVERKGKPAVAADRCG